MVISWPRLWPIYSQVRKSIFNFFTFSASSTSANLSKAFDEEFTGKGGYFSDRFSIPFKPVDFVLLTEMDGLLAFGLMVISRWLHWYDWLPLGGPVGWPARLWAQKVWWWRNAVLSEHVGARAGQSHHHILLQIIVIAKYIRCSDQRPKRYDIALQLCRNLI